MARLEEEQGTDLRNAISLEGAMVSSNAASGKPRGSGVFIRSRMRTGVFEVVGVSRGA
jgi:hypothetical protein